jgi:Rnl2 family RNA ligase
MEFQKFSSLENTYNQKLIDKVVYEGKNTGRWIVTEKLHGANFSFWCDGSEVKVASRTQFVDGTFFNCQAVINKHSPHILEWHKKNLTPGDSLVVYGELYGANIQKEVTYGERRFSAFDVRINKEVQDKVKAVRISAEMGLEFSPILHFGTFEECMNVPHEFRSKETPEDFPDDQENFAEGLVIEPIEPDWFNNGSRIYFKNKTPAFTEKKARVHKTPMPALPDEMRELLESVLEYCSENRVRNVISKIGQVTNKDFGRVGGLLVQDMIEEFEKETGVVLKTVAESHWKQFAGVMSREAIAVARPVILESMA